MGASKAVGAGMGSLRVQQQQQRGRLAAAEVPGGAALSALEAELDEESDLEAMARRVTELEAAAVEAHEVAQQMNKQGKFKGTVNTGGGMPCGRDVWVSIRRNDAYGRTMYYVLHALVV